MLPFLLKNVALPIKLMSGDFLFFCQGLACLIDKPIAEILPFAKYYRSSLWPYGRLVRNSSGCHGECVINNKAVLLYLGSNVKTIDRTIKLLREHSVYVNK